MITLEELQKELDVKLGLQKQFETSYAQLIGQIQLLNHLIEKEKSLVKAE